MAHTGHPRPLAGILLIVLALAATAAMVSITVAGEPRVGILMGRVVDVKGQPISGAFVTVPTLDEDETREVTTDETGIWRAAGVPVGYHTITASRRGYGAGSQESGSLSEGDVLITGDIVLHPEPDSLDVSLYSSQSVQPGTQLRLYVQGTLNQPEARVEFRVYPFDLAAEQTGSTSSDFSAQSRYLDPATAPEPPVWSWERTYSTSEKNGWFSGEPLTPALDRVGSYLVVARLGDLTDTATLNVTDLSMVVKRDRGQTLVWCTKSGSGATAAAAPAAGAAVEVFVNGDVIASGITDTDGLFRAGGARDEHTIVLARLGGSLAISNAYHYSSSYRRDSLIYTDRPIYRPGHTVFFKGIFRRQKPGGFSVTADRPVLFEIHDSEGMRVASIPATTNAMGSASGSWTSGDDARVGRYSVVVELDGARYEADFSVEEYRKPEYAAAISIEKSHHVSGEPLKATLRSNYYFGAPVARADVTYVVYSADYYFWEYDNEYESWFDSEEGYGYGYGGYGDVVAQGRGTTDENGELQIEIGTGGVEKESRWTIEAHVVDATMREVQARADTLVVPADFHIQVTPQRYVVSPGDEALFDVRTLDWDRNPVANKTLDVTIEKVAWRRSRELKTPVTTMQIKTGAGGRGLLRWKADTEGSIEVRLSGKDAAGRTASSTSDVFVAEDSYTAFEGNRPDESLTVTPDKKMYRKGDTARLLVSTREKSPAVLVTIEGQTLHDARVVRFSGSSQVLEIPILDEYLPNVSVVCTLVSGGGMLAQEAPIAVSPEDSLLTVKVEAEKKRYKPGETARFTIQTLDQKGRGVPAEVSLGVVDESIYALRNDSTPDIQKYFWGPRESEVSTSFSGEGYYYGGLDKFDSKVRRYFPDTAYWNPFIRTDAQGVARVSFAMPDNLTTWRATARAVTAETQAGSAISKVKVTKDLIVRLQAPRFFRERDSQTLGVIVHNYTGQPRQVRVRLTARGLTLKDNAWRTVSIPADGTAKLTASAEATSAGKASILAEAIAGERVAMDAIEIPFEVFPHGSRMTVTAAGSAPASSSASLEIERDAKLEGASLEIEITPSPAGAVLQGLQYLAHYPWGCVEQTISSFVPCVLMKRASGEAGMPLSESLEKDLPGMIAQGVKRLREMQHADGSWGWYFEQDADLTMTAYALIGLVEAQKAGANIPQDMIQSAVAWIRDRTVQELPPRPEARDWQDAGPGYLGHLEARAYGLMAAAATGAGDQQRFAPLFARRAELSNVALACLGLAAADTGRPAELETIARLLESKQTRSSGMALWRSSETRYYWSDAGATALAVRALARAGRSPESLTPAVRWLSAKRDGGYWNNTRDSALAILALIEHIERINPQPCRAEVRVNGRPAGQVSLTREDFYRAPKRFVIGPSQLKRGANSITVTRTGSGPLYWTGLLSYFSGAEDLPPQAGYFSVERSYGKVQLVKGSGGSYVEKVVPLRGAVRAGEVLRARVKVKASGDASYVLIESPLPSGFEVVNKEREWSWMFSGMQVRDEKVGLFSRTLPGGTTVMEYDLRAEVPGRLHVMPTQVSAMYSPAMFGSSDEKRLTVR